MVHFEAQGLKVTIASAAAGAYAGGDVVGALVKLAAVVPDSHGSLELMSLAVADTAKQAKGFNLYFFESAVTVPADNAAFDVSAADAFHYLGHVNVADADYVSTTNRSFAAKTNLRLLLQTGKAPSNNVKLQDLWVVLVTTGAPTYTASCLQLILGFKKQR